MKLGSLFSLSFHDDLISLLRTIEKFWKAKVILVTPQEPRFRICCPPYFDTTGKPRFESVARDRDLNVTEQELKKFERLVEDYFHHAV